MPTTLLPLPIDPKGEFKFNEAPPYVATSLGDGMAVDKIGRYYITSALGVQIFDPTGRPCGVPPKVDKDQPLTTASLRETITVRCTSHMGRRFNGGS